MHIVSYLCRNTVLLHKWRQFKNTYNQYGRFFIQSKWVNKTRFILNKAVNFFFDESLILNMNELKIL